MKITSAVAVDIDVGFQRQELQTTRVASPMSCWPEYTMARSSWMWPSRRTFVRVVTSDGVTGWGCTNGGEVTALSINRHLGPLIEGCGADDIEDLWNRMFHSLLPVDRSGFAMMAISAIDIALWDIRTKSMGRSLVDLLGGATKHSDMPTYLTTTKPEAAADYPWWGLKAAIPYGRTEGATGMAQNVDLIRRFRHAAGNDRPVMVDAFMAWDASYTIEFARKTEDFSLYWIEDPLPPQDIGGLETVKRALDGNILLALGNFAFNRWDCEALLRAGVVDILQPDVCWAGGITECRRIVQLAADAGVPVILHNTCEQPWALAMSSSQNDLPVVERVDRGAESLLYGLLGDEAHITNGNTMIPNSTNGNVLHPQLQPVFDRRLSESTKQENVREVDHGFS